VKTICGRAKLYKQNRHHNLNIIFVAGIPRFKFSFAHENSASRLCHKNEARKNASENCVTVEIADLASEAEGQRFATVEAAWDNHKAEAVRYFDSERNPMECLGCGKEGGGRDRTLVVWEMRLTMMRLVVVFREGGKLIYCQTTTASTIERFQIFSFSICTEISENILPIIVTIFD
jgi:hypothetical protein